jgi:hypothetical protein
MHNPIGFDSVVGGLTDKTLSLALASSTSGESSIGCLFATFRRDATAVFDSGVAGCPRELGASLSLLPSLSPSHPPGRTRALLLPLPWEEAKLPPDLPAVISTWLLLPLLCKFPDLMGDKLLVLLGDLVGDRLLPLLCESLLPAWSSVLVAAGKVPLLFSLFSLACAIPLRTIKPWISEAILDCRVTRNSQCP